MHRGTLALTMLALALASSACTKDKDKSDPKDASTGQDGSVEQDGSTDQDAAPEKAGPVFFRDHPPLGKKCNGKAGPSVSGPLPMFTAQTISNQPGAAYMLPVDLNDDAYPEFLLTTLSEGFQGGQIPPISAGGAYVLSREGGKATGSLGTFKTKKVFNKDNNVTEGGESVGVGFPNGSELVDIDNDGINDWVIGAGFIPKPRGLIVWAKGAKDGSFGAVKAIPIPDPKCWYHLTLPIDLDKDGDQDFITTCHVGDRTNLAVESRMEWFENPGDASGAFKHHSIGSGGGTLLTLYDLDEDGDQDIIAPQFFEPNALVWYEQTGAKGTAWTQHVINTSTGRGFIARIADMNGDGRNDIVYCNHNNEIDSDPINQTMGIYWFDIPGKDEIRTLTNWDSKIHKVHEGFEVDGDGNAISYGAPGMMSVGDIDGDCDYDVAVSGDGDLGLYLFVQQADSFEKIELSRQDINANSGEQHMIDMDGDGDLDIAWAIFGPQGGLMLQSRIDVFVQN